MVRKQGKGGKEENSKQDLQEIWFSIHELRVHDASFRFFQLLLLVQGKDVFDEWNDSLGCRQLIASRTSSFSALPSEEWQEGSVEQDLKEGCGLVAVQLDVNLWLQIASLQRSKDTYVTKIIPSSVIATLHIFTNKDHKADHWYRMLLGRFGQLEIWNC